MHHCAIQITSQFCPFHHFQNWWLLFAYMKTGCTNRSISPLCFGWPFGHISAIMCLGTFLNRKDFTGHTISKWVAVTSVLHPHMRSWYQCFTRHKKQLWSIDDLCLARNYFLDLQFPTALQGEHINYIGMSVSLNLFNWGSNGFEFTTYCLITHCHHINIESNSNSRI